MAMTLLEASKIHKGDVVRAGIIEMFARESEPLRVLPFLDVPGGSYHYTQEGSLPGVGFRGINQGFEESVGVLNPQVEVLRIAGGDLDVDNAILKMHGEDVRTTHEAMKVKALSLYFNKKLIKGDSSADVREFDGLQARITGSQLIANGNTANGDPLSLGKLDEAIDAVDGANYLLMSKAQKRIITAAARDIDVGGHISYTVDEFGRKVTNYNDLPILVVDYDELGQRILDFNEANPGGGTPTGSSIYVVNFSENMLTGIQNGTMDVRDLGEIDDKPVKRTRVEWLISLAALHGRCAARLWGINSAAATV